MRRERLFTSLVVVFALLGTALLLYLSGRATAPEVELGDLASFEGEQVVVEGTVVGTESDTLYLYGDSTVAKVYLNDRVPVKVLDRVRLRAQVIYASEMPALEMISSQSFVKRGVDTAVQLTLPLLEEEEGLVSVEGVTRAVAREGIFQKGYIMPTAALEEVFTAGVPFSWYGASEELKEGSIVKALGVLTQGKLHLYGEDSIQVEGRLLEMELTIGELMRRVSSGDGDVLFRPLNLRGYVLYEPRGESVYLTESLPEGILSLKCLLNSTFPLHKGDFVEVRNATLSLDEDTLRYTLLSDEVEVLLPHGPWNVTVEGIASAPLSFLGASVVVEGVARAEGDGILLEGRSGGRIWVVGVSLNDGTSYRVEGEVVYLKERSAYAISLEG
ncbi:MAG: hypothetical protein DRN42_06125 [Thermoplasmata archaeon]|nr:MAG: hypothetical protein DRN42_06125 [Thermoplasmata archaeon]